MFKQWIIKQIVVCFLIITVATQDKKSDENRPYEFGFTVEGQQHRHEAKDENGLVTGEFGFITADGVYHVTVYATDENGRFKILSMKSIKVSPPLDGSPDRSSVPIQGSLSDLQKSGGSSKGGINKPAIAAPRFGVTFSTTTSRPIDHSSIPLKATVSGFNPPAANEFTTPKSLPVASCGSCTLPSTTAAPPGANPNKFIFQTPEFQNSPAPQSGFPQIDVGKLNKITSSHYFVMNQETPNVQHPDVSSDNYPSVPEIPNRELLGPFSTPRPSVQNISPFSSRARKLDSNGNKFSPQSPNTLGNENLSKDTEPNSKITLTSDLQPLTSTIQYPDISMSSKIEYSSPLPNLLDTTNQSQILNRPPNVQISSVSNLPPLISTTQKSDIFMSSDFEYTSPTSNLLEITKQPQKVNRPLKMQTPSITNVPLLTSTTQKSEISIASESGYNSPLPNFVDISEQSQAIDGLSQNLPNLFDSTKQLQESHRPSIPQNSLISSPPSVFATQKSDISISSNVEYTSPSYNLLETTNEPHKIEGSRRLQDPSISNITPQISTNQNSDIGIPVNIPYRFQPPNILIPTEQPQVKNRPSKPDISSTSSLPPLIFTTQKLNNSMSSKNDYNSPSSHLLEITKQSHELIASRVPQNPPILNTSPQIPADQNSDQLIPVEIYPNLPPPNNILTSTKQPQVSNRPARPQISSFSSLSSLESTTQKSVPPFASKTYKLGISIPAVIDGNRPLIKLLNSTKPSQKPNESSKEQIPLISNIPLIVSTTQRSEISISPENSYNPSSPNSIDIIEYPQGVTGLSQKPTNSILDTTKQSPEGPSITNLPQLFPTTQKSLYEVDYSSSSPNIREKTKLPQEPKGTLGPQSPPIPDPYPLISTTHKLDVNLQSKSDYNPPPTNLLDATKHTQEPNGPQKSQKSQNPLTSNTTPLISTQKSDISKPSKIGYNPTSSKSQNPTISNLTPNTQKLAPTPMGRAYDISRPPNVLDDRDVISMPVQNDQHVGPLPSDLLIPTGTVRPVTKPIIPSIPEGLSFPGLIHPAKPRKVDGEQPVIDGPLPPGVTVDDMRELLYKFNYSVGFHGHYEMGYRNGVKIGGYYVNGRDGYSRIVEYIADERGYHPKVYYVFLGLDSPDTPKTETEKEYGLKGQVFEWYSIS